MSFVENYDFENLKNEAEKIVIAELGIQLESFPGKVCTCNDCVLDMAAMALNAVKPLYRVSLLGTLYTSHAMDEGGYAVSVHEAVAKAVEKVSQNPSHPPVEEPKEQNKSDSNDLKKSIAPIENGKQTERS